MANEKYEMPVILAYQIAEKRKAKHEACLEKMYTCHFFIFQDLDYFWHIYFLYMMRMMHVNVVIRDEVKMLE